MTNPIIAKLQESGIDFKTNFILSDMIENGIRASHKITEVPVEVNGYEFILNITESAKDGILISYKTELQWSTSPIKATVFMDEFEITFNIGSGGYNKTETLLEDVEAKHAIYQFYSHVHELMVSWAKDEEFEQNLRKNNEVYWEYHEHSAKIRSKERENLMNERTEKFNNTLEFVFPEQKDAVRKIRQMKNQGEESLEHVTEDFQIIGKDMCMESMITVRVTYKYGEFHFTKIDENGKDGKRHACSTKTQRDAANIIDRAVKPKA